MLIFHSWSLFSSFQNVTRTDPARQFCVLSGPRGKILIMPLSLLSLLPSSSLWKIVLLPSHHLIEAWVSYLPFFLLWRIVNYNKSNTIKLWLFLYTKPLFYSICSTFTTVIIQKCCPIIKRNNIRRYHYCVVGITESFKLTAVKKERKEKKIICKINKSIK